VKLDASFLRYLSKDDFRVLVAIEMGMKNHDLVPVPLINSLSNLRFGGTYKGLENLHKHKLIFHQGKPYDGYRLTYSGYDFLSLKTFSMRGTVAGVGQKVGVGKESDIYIVINESKQEMILKLHRLGRTSFRTIKNNRDYLQHRKSASWLYLSRLAALKEYSYMKALHENNFPVPTPIDYNRHSVLMSVVQGYPLYQVKEMKNVDKVYKKCMDLIVKLATYGLIHGDFNEFNILVNNDEEITVIDFPQMVSTDHENAEWYFDRDVECIRSYFNKRFGFTSDYIPRLGTDTKRINNLDKDIFVSGYTKEKETDFRKLYEELIVNEIENPELVENEFNNIDNIDGIDNIDENLDNVDGQIDSINENTDNIDENIDESGEKIVIDIDNIYVKKDNQTINIEEEKIIIIKDLENIDLFNIEKNMEETLDKLEDKIEENITDIQQDKPENTKEIEKINDGSEIIQKEESENIEKEIENNEDDESNTNDTDYSQKKSLIAKRVRKQITKKEQKKKNNRNQYKNKKKRAVRESVKEW